MDVRLAQSEKSLDAPVGDADGRSIAKVDMMPSVGAGPEAQMADDELQALVKDKLAEFRNTLIGKDKDLAIFDCASSPTIRSRSRTSATSSGSRASASASSSSASSAGCATT